MPHFVIEYSSNLEDRIDPPGLVTRLHQAAVDTGVFPIKGIRTRAVRRECCRVADGHPDNGFVHIDARIGPGRPLELRKAVGTQIFEAICEYLQPVYEDSPLGISMEIREIHPELGFRKNNLLGWVERRARERVPP